MTTRSTFEELLEVARTGGIQVRHVALGGSGGGIAMVRGQRCLFVDADADPEEQLERTVSALAQVQNLGLRNLRADVAALLQRAGWKGK